MEENTTAVRDHKTFYFDTDWLKDIDENLKYKIEFIIKLNEFLAENKIKTKTKQLFLKHKDKDNNHDQEKQQNKWTR